jgi:transcription termination factor Rho
MKTNSTQKRIGAAIVWSFLLIAGIGFSSTAQAQYPNNQYPNNGTQDGRNRNRRGRNWDNYGNYGGSFDLRQTALNAGYNEGMRDGTAARQKNRSDDFRNQSAYRKANKDYNSRLGDRDLYSRYFREAYETGFNDGYSPGRNDSYNNGNSNNNGNYPDNNGNWDRNNRRGRNWDRYGSYGGNSQLRQTALNAGYNEGIKQGRSDRSRRNNGSDFRNNNAYRDASKDYSSKLGDRGLYQRYYREGYENGYYDGLNGY